MLRSLNHGYTIGELSITQKQGIITCIPKDNKPKIFLKNWRPLTLLDTVYKLASGTIVNRIKTVLDSIINKDQTGFMFLFCLVFAMFCARLFICALWSPAGKGLTSWLSFVVSTVSLSLSYWYPGSGVVLNCIDS